VSYRACLLVLLMLAACATPGTPDFTPARESWQGARYDDVVAQWGAATRSTRIENGDDVRTWVSETSRGRGGPSVGFGIFSGGRGGGVGIGAGVPFGGSADLVRCERTLVFREGRLIDQTWNGETDYCGTFRRR
jgi:hypothetical protein